MKGWFRRALPIASTLSARKPRVRRRGNRSRESGIRGARAALLFTLRPLRGGRAFPKAYRQVDYDHEIRPEYNGGNQSGMLQKMPKLERHVNSRAKTSDPFGPSAPVPKAVGFYQSQAGIRSGPCGQQPELGVVKGIREFQKHLRRVVCRVQMKVVHERLGQMPGVMMQHSRQAAANEQYEQALCCLKQGERPQPATGARWLHEPNRKNEFAVASVSAAIVSMETPLNIAICAAT